MIPGVWPLHGSALRAQKYFFDGNEPRVFPPLGMLLEVGTYKKPLTMANIGQLEMLNLQRLLFAWLLSFQAVAKAAGADDIRTDPSLEGWRSNFNNVTMHFVHIAGGSAEPQAQQKAIMVYALQESDDKSAEDIGHSVLMGSRELAHFMESAKLAGLSGSAQDVEKMLSNIKWARDDTAMNVRHIRLHLCVLRRLSMAVRDMSQPMHTDSALYWFEKSEEICERQCASTSIQESPKYLDAFCTALADTQRLRDAAEKLQTALLRGHPLRGGRNVGEWAWALASALRSALSTAFWLSEQET